MAPPSFPAGFAAMLLLLCLAMTASAVNFTCTVRATCQSAIIYTTPNATTYAELLSRFNTTTIGELLRANGLTYSTDISFAATYTVFGGTIVRVPYRCLCAGDRVGRSDRRPIYTVQLLDGLDEIARNVFGFGAFVTYQEIATANNIPDPNRIYVGQELWIPLPCSCDQVDGYNVTHFAYQVQAGDTTSAIAAKFGVRQATLRKINGIHDRTSLLMGQILDVPVPVLSISTRF
uniref:LysM domain-containing protein n=1 Tax=Oryza glumipatula TaxID=40148 RepID=A0A0E0BK34_9ORYZ